jgi:hypothetical protein
MAAEAKQLIELFNAKRSYIEDEYLRFNREMLGKSKFSQDEEATIRQRIDILLDKCIDSIAKNDDNILLDYTRQITQARIAAGYGTDAILKLWEWGIEFFGKLVEENLAPSPEKVANARYFRSLLTRAKLVVVSAHLNQFEQ